MNDATRATLREELARISYVSTRSILDLALDTSTWVLTPYSCLPAGQQQRFLWQADEVIKALQDLGILERT